MKVDAPIVDQVRDLLAEAALVVSMLLERQRVEALHVEVVGLVEAEARAHEVTVSLLEEAQEERVCAECERRWESSWAGWSREREEAA